MIVSSLKKLPEPIKKPLRYLYYKSSLGIKLDKDLIKYLKEYFSLSEKKVIFYLKKSRKLNAGLWELLNPKNEQEIKSFYSFNPYYVFSLAHWHMYKTQRDFRRQIIKSSQGNVLDYGAGIGDLCIELVKKGLTVNYADLNGKTFEFAKWLFKKNNLDIKMIDLSKEALTQEYDTVICVDVIEHVSDPRALLRDLALCVRRGGSLIITNLQLEEISQDHPMHFKIDFNAEKYLKTIGFEKKEPSWLWIKN